MGSLLQHLPAIFAALAVILGSVALIGLNRATRPISDGDSGRLQRFIEKMQTQ